MSKQGGCTLVDKFITGDRSAEDCHHWDHSSYQFLFWAITLTSIAIVIGLFAHDHHVNYWDNVPMVEREVLAVVIYDESSKCVFVVDGERLRATAPCKFSVGDIVETKSDGNRVYMYDGVYDDTRS